MHPKNEEQVCKVVMCVIERRDGGPLTITERPDKPDPAVKIGQRPKAVELLFKGPTKHYAMEHTLIESFPMQIKDGMDFVALLEPLEQELSGVLPGTYTLTVSVGVTGGISVGDHPRIRELVSQWILSSGPSLECGASRKGPRCVITERPMGVPFSLTLYRSTASGSRLKISRFSPEDLEDQRLERVREALKRKCPKLSKHQDDRETVLALEYCDIALGAPDKIGLAVGLALAERVDRKDAPHSIFLVDTYIERPWPVWTLKEGADVFPCPRLRDLDPVEL